METDEVIKVPAAQHKACHADERGEMRCAYRPTPLDSYVSCPGSPSGNTMVCLQEQIIFVNKLEYATWKLTK
jgi:hypothetical protein